MKPCETWLRLWVYGSLIYVLRITNNPNLSREDAFANGFWLWWRWRNRTTRSLGPYRLPKPLNAFLQPQPVRPYLIIIGILQCSPSRALFCIGFRKFFRNENPNRDDCSFFDCCCYQILAKNNSFFFVLRSFFILLSFQINID